MSIDSVHEWWWYGAAIAIAVGGAALLLWALLWDRARGRARCPKCWYDMAAQADAPTPTCPECGRLTKRPRRLRKTRRHRRWALLAVMVLLTANFLRLVPQIKAYGWAHVAPTTVLIWLLPSIEDRQDPLYIALAERLSIPSNWATFQTREDLELWWWQRRLLVTRCATALESDTTEAARRVAMHTLQVLGPEAAPAVPALIALAESDIRSVKWVVGVLEQIGPAAAPAVPGLVRLLTEANPKVPYYSAHSVIRALASIGPQARPAIPALIRIVEEEPGGSYYSVITVRTALYALGEIGPAAVEALPLIVSVAREPSSRARVAAILATGGIGPTKPECRLLYVHAMSDLNLNVRQAAADVLRTNTDECDFVVRNLTTILSATDVEKRIAGARGLMILGTSAVDSLPQLRHATSDTDPTVRLFAMCAIRSMGDHAAAALPEILKAMNDDDDEAVRHEAMRAHKAINTSPENTLAATPR